VAGGAPAGFGSQLTGYSVDVWMPLRALTDAKLLASHTMAFFSVMGRLQPGVGVSQAEAELTTLYQQIQRSEPPSSIRADALFMHLAPGAQGLGTLRSRFGQPLQIAVSVVGVVLLIAALNVATLLLARGAARGPELATRAALGAGRGVGWRSGRDPLERCDVACGHGERRTHNAGSRRTAAHARARRRAARAVVDPGDGVGAVATHDDSHCRRGSRIPPGPRHRFPG